MDMSKPLPYFRVERYSHHFVVKDMSPMGQAASEAFARNYIQYGMIKIGRFFRRGPLKVFAAKVARDNEIRFHVGQWDAWKQFLSDRGIGEKCYTEEVYGFADPEALNANLKEGWVAHDYQEPIIEYLKTPQPSTRKLVEIQPGKGKSQPGYSKIRTPSGWKRMDDIVVGDLVLSHDGSFTKVLEVYENGRRPIHRIICEDGRSADADKEHLWRITYLKANKPVSCVVTTEHIALLLEQKKRVFLPTIEADMTVSAAADQDESLAEDVYRGIDRKEDLLKMEFQSFYARRMFIRQMMNHCMIAGDLGVVFLDMTEPNEHMEQVFRSCGFVITWDSGEEAGNRGYDLWHAHIEKFADYNKEDLCYAKQARVPFYGVEVAQVEKLEDQYDAYCILVEHPLHLYVTDGYIVTHNTFCASSAIASMGHRMIAFLKPKYLEKWVRDLKSILDIDPEHIEVIQGSSSLMRVMGKAREGSLDCKAILVSNRTYQHFITNYEKEGKAVLDQGYDCLPHEFIQLTGCGVRLVDEVHEDFHLNFKIDLYTHVPWAISLSATLVSDDPFISRMHNVAYTPEIRYNGLAYDKYVDSHAFRYRIRGGEYLRTTEMGSTNYSHMAFEKNFFKDKKLLMEYLSLINSRLELRYLNRKKGKQRCLIYAASIQMCTYICEYLKHKHPDLDIRRYVEDDPYDNLMESEVCVSTIGSAGTGHDIPDLITVLLTVAIASKASNIQGFGRLRKLRDTDVIFEYFTCLDIPKHVEYHERKEQLLAGMAKSVSVETLSVPLGDR